LKNGNNKEKTFLTGRKRIDDSVTTILKPMQIMFLIVFSLSIFNAFTVVAVDPSKPSLLRQAIGDDHFNVR
jgi:hypothetical protein